MRDREAAASPEWFVAVLFFSSMLGQQCAPSSEQALLIEVVVRRGRAG